MNKMKIELLGSKGDSDSLNAKISLGDKFFYGEVETLNKKYCEVKITREQRKLLLNYLNIKNMNKSKIDWTGSTRKPELVRDKKYTSCYNHMHTSYLIPKEEAKTNNLIKNKTKKDGKNK